MILSFPIKNVFYRWICMITLICIGLSPLIIVWFCLVVETNLFLAMFSMHIAGMIILPLCYIWMASKLYTNDTYSSYLFFDQYYLNIFKNHLINWKDHVVKGLMYGGLIAIFIIFGFLLLRCDPSLENHYYTRNNAHNKIQQTNITCCLLNSNGVFFPHIFSNQSCLLNATHLRHNLLQMGLRSFLSDTVSFDNRIVSKLAFNRHILQDPSSIHISKKSHFTSMNDAFTGSTIPSDKVIGNSYRSIHTSQSPNSFFFFQHSIFKSCYDLFLLVCISCYFVIFNPIIEEFFWRIFLLKELTVLFPKWMVQHYVIEMNSLQIQDMMSSLQYELNTTLSEMRLSINDIFDQRCRPYVSLPIEDHRDAHELLRHSEDNELSNSTTFVNYFFLFSQYYYKVKTIIKKCFIGDPISLEEKQVSPWIIIVENNNHITTNLFNGRIQSSTELNDIFEDVTVKQTQLQRFAFNNGIQFEDIQLLPRGRMILCLFYASYHVIVLSQLLNNVLPTVTHDVSHDVWLNQSIFFIFKSMQWIMYLILLSLIGRGFLLLRTSIQNGGILCAIGAHLGLDLGVVVVFFLTICRY